MRTGSLVRFLPEYAHDDHYSQWPGTGLVLGAVNDIELPPTLEILWDNGHTTFCSEDDLELIEI